MPVSWHVAAKGLWGGVDASWFRVVIWRRLVQGEDVACGEKLNGFSRCCVVLWSCGLLKEAFCINTVSLILGATPNYRDGIV